MNPGQARKALAKIFNTEPNNISFSRHALSQMKERNLTTGDVLNVLKVGTIHGGPEFENGSWRYHVQTNKITVVIAFRNPNFVAVVTAWRN